jgi:hypothetical protein
MADKNITNVHSELAIEEASNKPHNVQQIIGVLEWLAVIRKGVIEKDVTVVIVRNHVAGLKRAPKL